jgi:hypothetical protein
MANEEGKCIKCGDPVYVAPNGHVAKLCALCIFQAFANLGVFEQSAHLTKDAPDLGESSASDSESKPAPKRVI